MLEVYLSSILAMGLTLLAAAVALTCAAADHHSSYLRLVPHRLRRVVVRFIASAGEDALRSADPARGQPDAFAGAEQGVVPTPVAEGTLPAEPGRST